MACSILALFVWLPQVSAAAAATASAAAAASMKTVVVRFADAAAAADAVAYYIATAGFIGVSRRTRRSDAAFRSGVRRSFLRQRNEQELTQNVDAAAAAGPCGNQTNSPYVYSSMYLIIYRLQLHVFSIRGVLIVETY